MVQKRFRKRERALNTIKSGFQKLEPVVKGFQILELAVKGFQILKPAVKGFQILEPVVNKTKVIMPLFPLGVVDPRSMLFGLIIITIVGPLHAQRLIK